MKILEQTWFQIYLAVGLIYGFIRMIAKWKLGMNVIVQLVISILAMLFASITWPAIALNDFMISRKEDCDVCEGTGELDIEGEKIECPECNGTGKQ